MEHTISLPVTRDKQIPDMTTVAKLIADFHNLPGDTFQQKHKSFRSYLVTVKETLRSKDDEDRLIAEVKPRNNLEHLFRIDLLSHLKRNDDLLEILKSGNKNHIGRILKNYQFFAEVIPTLQPDTLINDFFPKTSFVTKSKIINRISKVVKNEELIDKYFLAIEEKYGQRLAFGLLPGCSIKLIKLKTQQYKPKLSSRHITEIYKKDPSFPLFYFNTLKDQDDGFDVFKEYPMVIQYIARKDIGLFWKLQTEFQFDFKTGKHLTKKLILQNEEVLKNGEKCVKWFQIKKLYNTINRQGKMDQFLFSFYPDTPIEFLETYMDSYSNIYSILKCLTADKRFDLFQDLFNKKYSKNILDYQMKFSQDFLKLLPVAVREPIVKQHLQKSDDYTYLLGTAKAVSSIKEMLQNCSTSEQRTQKLQELCKVLEMNRNDKETITEVFKFIFERYRNDTKALKTFIANFTDNSKNLKALDEEQLKLLNQMGTYTLSDYRSRYNAEKISVAYLQCLIKNNRNYNDHLTDYLKRISTDNMHYDYIFTSEFENMNIVLEKIIAVVDRFKDNEEAYKILTKGLTNHIVSYNNCYKKSVIPLTKYKHILEYVLNDKTYSNTTLLKYVINCHDKNLHKYFWEHYENTYEFDMLYQFLKNDVKQVEENLELILSHAPYCTKRYVYEGFKMYLTESLRKKIVEYVKNKITFDDPRYSVFLITLLSYVDSEEFLTITAPYMPPLDGKMEMENATNKIEVQKAVILGLCNIESKNLLQTVRNVCVGDYLKYGLIPLYKIAYNMKEIDILPFLNDLKKSPVSVGKHSLLLARHLLSVNEASEFIQKALEKEGNASMKNIIFRKSLDIFVETQTELAWKQLHNYFRIINCDDTTMHDILIKYINKIPPIHVNDYIQSTYEIVKKTASKEGIMKIISLAKNIPHSAFDSLSFMFLEEIIGTIVREMFLHEQCEDCFWDYVLHTNSIRSKQLLSCTLEFMKTIISSTKPGYAKLRIPLNHFATTFCDKLLKEKNIVHKELVEMLYLQWSFFPKHCLLDVALLLKITVTYYESGFDLDKFAFSLNKLLHSCIEEYDSSIISEFSTQLTAMYRFADVKDEALRQFADLFLRCNDHKYNYILVINILPKETFPLEDNKYRKWVGIIKSIEEYGKKGKGAASVLYHYNKYLCYHRNEYIWIGNQQFPSVATTKL